MSQSKLFQTDGAVLRIGLIGFLHFNNGLCTKLANSILFERKSVICTESFSTFWMHNLLNHLLYKCTSIDPEYTAGHNPERYGDILHRINFVLIHTLYYKLFIMWNKILWFIHGVCLYSGSYTIVLATVRGLVISKQTLTEYSSI